MSGLRAYWHLVTNVVKRQKEQTFYVSLKRVLSLGATVVMLRCLAGDEVSMYEAIYKIETDTQLTEAQLLKAFNAVLVFSESYSMSYHES